MIIRHKILAFIFLFGIKSYCQTIDYYTKGKEEFLTGDYKKSTKDLLMATNNLKQRDLNYLIAMSYFNLKKFDTAIIYFNKDLKENPNNFNGYIKRAESKKYISKYQAAILDLNELLKKEPNYYLAYYEKGDLNFELKKYKEAIDDYNHALLLRANFEKAFYKVGFCYLNLKDTIQACESWKKIEDLDDYEEYQKIEILCNKFIKTK